LQTHLSASPSMQVGIHLLIDHTSFLPLCSAGCWGTGTKNELSSCPNLCPPGTFSTGGAGECTKCPLGTASTSIGATSADVCERCEIGSYSSAPGSSECSTCSPTGCTEAEGCHWTSDSANFSSCACTGDWVGSDCEVLPCKSVLGGFSLVGLVFQADPQIRRYSSTFNSTEEQPKDALKYLQNLAKVQIDVNGDGVMTREEVLNTLFYRSVRSANISKSLPLWCRNADVANSDCVGEDMLTADLIDQAYDNFMRSEEHTFDGSGIFSISNMQSTYPNPDWSDEDCISHDSFQTPVDYDRVTTKWEMDFTGEYTLRQVCGFVNGLASAEFTTTELLSGTATSFLDDVPVSADYGFKRVYCLAVQYCRNDHCESGETLEKYECSVGLFFVSRSSNIGVVAQ
jgi:hypothetical protein